MRKFYTDVGVAGAGEGFAVTLDGKPIKTPVKNPLVMSTEALAEIVADEWRAQDENIVPNSMPMTTLVNTAVDRVTPRRVEIIEEMVAYGHTDLVCYRADEPDDLVALQQKVWDPYLAWLKSELGVDLSVATGVLPLTQSDAVIARLTAEISPFNDFSLTAFHAFVGGFGSIVLALAAVRNFAAFDDCWQASILDQTFQESLWGTDPEVLDGRARLKAELLTSVELWHLSQA